MCTHAFVLEGKEREELTRFVRTSIIVTSLLLLQLTRQARGPLLYKVCLAEKASQGNRGRPELLPLQHRLDV